MSYDMVNNDITGIPAYSDTGYSDTPVTVAFLTVPKWPFYMKNDVVTVILAYSDTFCSSRGCHCKRGCLYHFLSILPV